MPDSTIPVIGHKFIADFNIFKVILFFESETKLTWRPFPDGEETSETILMLEIKPNVYAVSWQENGGFLVTHIEDYNNMIVYTYLIDPTKVVLDPKDPNGVISNPQRAISPIKGTLTLMK